MEAYSSNEVCSLVFAVLRYCHTALFSGWKCLLENLISHFMMCMGVCACVWSWLLYLACPNCVVVCCKYRIEKIFGIFWHVFLHLWAHSCETYPFWGFLGYSRSRKTQILIFWLCWQNSVLKCRSNLLLVSQIRSTCLKDLWYVGRGGRRCGVGVPQLFRLLTHFFRTRLIQCRDFSPLRRYPSSLSSPNRVFSPKCVARHNLPPVMFKSIHAYTHVL